MIDCIPQKLEAGHEIFEKQCHKVGAFLDKNPSCYKAVLVASHIFRAATMFAAMESLPFSLPISCGLMLIPSLMYRSSIERFCIFRFTLPSLAGAVAMKAGKLAAISLLTKATLSSLGSILFSSLGIGCLAGYLAFICKLSNSDIENYMQNSEKKPCCTKKPTF